MIFMRYITIRVIIKGGTSTRFPKSCVLGWVLWNFKISEIVETSASEKHKKNSGKTQQTKPRL